MLSRQRGDKTLEQLHEPLSGHSDGGDDGQGDKPGDEAVFDRGGAVLVAQKFAKHSHSLSKLRSKTVWHVQVAIKTTKSVKLQHFVVKPKPTEWPQ